MQLGSLRRRKVIRREIADWFVRAVDQRQAALALGRHKGLCGQTPHHGRSNVRLDVKLRGLRHLIGRLGLHGDRGWALGVY